MVSLSDIIMEGWTGNRIYKLIPMPTDGLSQQSPERGPEAKHEDELELVIEI